MLNLEKQYNHPCYPVWAWTQHNNNQNGVAVKLLDELAETFAKYDSRNDDYRPYLGIENEVSDIIAESLYSLKDSVRSHLKEMQNYEPIPDHIKEAYESRLEIMVELDNADDRKIFAEFVKTYEIVADVLSAD